MATVIIILLILALIFGVGAVIEGLLWAFLIGLVLLVVAGVFGYRLVKR